MMRVCIGDGPIDAASRDFSSPSVETPFSGEDRGETRGEDGGKTVERRKRGIAEQQGRGSGKRVP